MASEHSHLEDAKKLYLKAVEEFEIAKEKNLSLQDNLHIECYYEQALDFDEVLIHLNDLRYYIEKIGELEEVRR